MLRRIEAARTIALIVHMHPDADSMGSACAMYAHLLRLGKKVTLFCASEEIDERLSCIPWSEKLTSKWRDDTELAIAFDCASEERMGVRPSCLLVNIDHHPGNEGFGDLAIVDAFAVSTSSVLMRWFKRESIPLNAKMATALYAGLADDSQGFMSHRTDAETFDMAAELICAGADIVQVNEALFHRRSLASLRLLSSILGAMQLHGDARIAVMSVTRSMIEQSGGGVSACDDALHAALGLPTVEVALLLREQRDGSVKVSLRTDNGVDVQRIASMFGGGGHHFAAGFVCDDTPMQRLSEMLIETIKKEMD
jgi:phosphoesterase RecJ-like protein